MANDEITPWATERQYFERMLRLRRFVLKTDCDRLFAAELARILEILDDGIVKTPYPATQNP